MHIWLRQNGPDIVWTPCTPFVALNLLPNGLTSAVRFATARLKEKDRERDQGGKDGGNKKGRTSLTGGKLTTNCVERGETGRDTSSLCSHHFLSASTTYCSQAEFRQSTDPGRQEQGSVVNLTRQCGNQALQRISANANVIDQLTILHYLQCNVHASDHVNAGSRSGIFRRILKSPKQRK